MWYGSLVVPPRQVAAVARDTSRAAGGGSAADRQAAAARRELRRSSRAWSRVIGFRGRAYRSSGRENLHQDRRRGETGLFDGTRVSKADPRVAAYGDVDELNAWLGLVRAARRRCRTLDGDARARSSAICSRSARGWPIPRTRSRSASTKAAVDDDDISAARRLDRRARVGAPAAAALHPRRRLAGGRRAAPGAHGLPARRARAWSALGARRGRAGAARLRQPAVRPALRHGARGQPPRRRPRNRVVNR